MESKTTDFLIIGGGVIGFNLAIQVKQRFPDCSVSLIDKEDNFGFHASGRNSGVLHAGFYYSADSFKAKFTRDGNAALTEYCLEKGIKINRCGKLVVTRNEEELATLNLLRERGEKNGVQLQEVTEQEAMEIEPRAKTFARALFSPTTSSVNPKEVMKHLVQDAVDAGIEIQCNAAYRSRKQDQVKINDDWVSCGYVINAAGLYADKIARDYGFSENYRILPFKGLYLYGDEVENRIKTNIYPVPDLNNPFLGVHFTTTADGAIKIGPTAIPAFWREQYSGLDNFRFDEMLEIVWRELGMFVRNENNFRRLAFEESKKYIKSNMVALSSELARDIKPENYTRWAAPGIRAQLFDLKKRALEMDFCYEGDSQSFHVLNAVSPAFTCSQPFVSYLIDQIESLVSKNVVEQQTT